MHRVTVGFLGCGNVGGGAYDIIQRNREEIALRDGIEIVVKRVLVRDLNKVRRSSCPREIMTTSASDVLDDPEISIVAEFLGGIEPSRTYILKALNAGKTVVTANKAVLSSCWSELETAAASNGVGLYYDASVAGGIPVLKNLDYCLQANRIDSLVGIINGTTNFILTKIADEGMSYENALKLAQEKGLAEADPTMDVSGMDVVYKLSILASLAFDCHIPIEAIYRQGIAAITPDDIRFGASLGLTLKLLAVAKRTQTGIEAHVHPTFIPDTHPLAGIRGAFNAVFLNGNAVGDIMLYGKGAGALPTGSSVVSDIITAASAKTHRYSSFLLKDVRAKLTEEWESCFYIRLTVCDEPGVLASIATILSRYGISVASCVQHNANDGTAPLVFLVHRVSNIAMRSAIDEIARLPEVKAVNNTIPVEY
ncbi:MAG: homoserine dehydrogenase [Eubacteriales bacterium]|nr:homoserine dehydrogenase [Eubacteriales bacterium]